MAAGHCPLKPVIECESTVELANDGRCICPKWYNTNTKSRKYPPTQEVTDDQAVRA